MPPTYVHPHAPSHHHLTGSLPEVTIIPFFSLYSFRVVSGILKTNAYV